METELEAIVRKHGVSCFKETGVKVITYLLKKSLNNKDLRCTGVDAPELQKFLQQHGYSEKDARREVTIALARLDPFLPSQWEIDEIEGKKYSLLRYYPSAYIRLLGKEYLKNHQEKHIREQTLFLREF